MSFAAARQTAGFDDLRELDHQVSTDL